MGFADKYVHSLGAANLMDDGLHHNTEPLAASGLADLELESVGALLYRVKFSDTARKDFEGNPANLASLLRAWNLEVIKRGTARQWVTVSTERDEKTLKYLCMIVSQASLAYFLDGKCTECGGTGLVEHRACKACDGTGEAPIKHKGAFIRERIADMVSELHGIVTSYAGRASARLREV